MEPQVLVDIQTAADTLGIGTYAASKRVARGRLPAVQPAGRRSRRLVPLTTLAGRPGIDRRVLAEVRCLADRAGACTGSVTIVTTSRGGERSVDVLETS